MIATCDGSDSTTTYTNHNQWNDDTSTYYISTSNYDREEAVDKDWWNKEIQKAKNQEKERKNWKAKRKWEKTQKNPKWGMNKPKFHK